MESSTKGKAKRRHLNSEECREISRRPEGSQPLTQPHSVTRRHSNSDTYRGLYPRTPTKRKRDARDDKKQQGITKFFPVISVVKVLSPQKAALSQGSGSVKTEGLNGELIPKIETIEEKALATSMKEEPEDEKVDYLEGLTTDMFGDDKEFERCWSDPDPALMNHHEEEEVEALPDALYGLLGSSRGLAHPQGHVDDLPEEVLMLVLSLLPAEDLYCNVSLVCQRWRNIVTQSLFVPWKKLYYRYTKKEINAVKEINAILETHRIIKDDQESILHIVEFMAQYKPSQKVKPESVLQSVRTHCLFPQAEACIKHRLPKLEGIEGGPNPWAAMALMLVLCDGVGDVLDLVVCLRGCLPSASAITEYLSAMATMLLAMRRNDINISNRWHYNIFYVLHLMENALPTVQVTHEQQQILNHDIHRDHVVKIMAFAGTGKTTTLIRYAQQRPHHHFLYMAFNKSVATQAQRCFPSNVDCRTVHSMAFGAVGKRSAYLNVKPFSVAWVVTLTLNAYMASADTHITPNHVPNTYKNTHGKMTVPDCNAKRMFARDAQRIWDKMVALEETREYAHHMTHDGYLKLWQLQRPTLDKYDVIFIDEAQDCTPAIMDIMLPQHCGKILVGDPHQQIYTFRGAVNALNLVEHTHLYYLTQSFRFGSEIAYIGATILQVCKKVKKILVGGKQDGCVWGKAVDSLRPLTTGLSPGRGKLAVLSRTNVSVFDQAVRLTDANPRCRLVFCLSLFKRAPFSFSRCSLGIKDSFIRRFTQQSLGGYFGLKSYAKKTEDRELEGKLSMVEKYNSRIPELVERIYGCTERQAQNADFILGTVHKSKGLEFDTVVITDDFAKVPCAAHNLPRLSSCSGGVCVCVQLGSWKTIFKYQLLPKEYFLRTELTSALLTEGQPPCCSVRECHNHITPVWPLAMCKLPLQYMDSADDGGPMCGACVLQRVGPTASLLASPELLKVLPVTEERLNLPINYALLMALF
uniref:F-box DNA helicase 1 n=1 Tax=Oncorhynchus kisutch TaxID=8019 RepID=A0A8C7CW46_ONCKI